MKFLLYSLGFIIIDLDFNQVSLDDCGSIIGRAEFSCQPGLDTENGR